MKWMVGFAMASVLLGAAQASSDGTERRALMIQACQSFSDVAGATMELRQLGMPVSEAMERAKSSRRGAHRLMEMTLSAYEFPQMQTEEVRAFMVKDFANQQYLACVGGFEG